MDPFAGIIDQHDAIHELREETRRGRLNHAYLLEGPTGTGRRTLARAFAASLLQTTPERLEHHVDYLELPRDCPHLALARFVERSGSSDLGHPPVLTFLQTKPLAGERRIALVPDAERMDAPAANAFLKTLEEPPGQAIIVLTTTARSRLLGTIVSRCRTLRVQPLDDERVAQALVERGTAGDAARSVATLAEGSLGQALTLVEGETLTHWQWLQSALGERTPAGAVALAQGMIQRAAQAGSDAAGKRQAAGRLLDLTALALRRELRSGTDPRAIHEALAALWDAGDQLASNVRLELVLRAAALNVIAALRGAR